MKNDTTLSHPLVRTYLRDLRFACAKLPPTQVQELSEQIRAHLGEVLPRDASDKEVLAALDKLGSPAQLAREAFLALPPWTLPQRAGARVAALTWRAWTAIAAAAVAALAVGGSFTAAMTAPPLDGPGSTVWWFPQDRVRQVYTSADGYQQSTVPIRSGQVQGFVVTVTNPGPWTQTIIGPGAAFTAPGGPDVRIGVSTTDFYRNHGYFPPRPYLLPVAIPPGQTRAVRVLWRSTYCMSKGSTAGIDTLPLEVRIGWVTRTENVPLGQGWYLSGPSQGRCI